MYYGNSFQPYVSKWGAADFIVKKQLGLGYRYFGVFLEKGKWIKLISHPVLALAVYYLKILVGISYLKSLKYENR